MTLLDLLVCPTCKGELDRLPDALGCQPCARRYPIEGGVPIMLEDPASVAQNEGELSPVHGYSAWKHRVILQSLVDSQIVVDFGAGNQSLDDPCIIRLDIHLGPFVDVVADLHALPFREGSIDYMFGGAVFEHLRQPFVAAAEIHRALKPGGYVYADCNFVFAYHGFPHHYFNASPQGLEQVFARFTRIDLGVAPYQRPSFALESVLGTYRTCFKPQTDEDRSFQHLLDWVVWQPLRSYDDRFGDDLFRVAAGCYFIGMKPSSAGETVVPDAILRAHAGSDELGRRFPAPLDLTAPDNLLLWARREGRHTDAAVAAAVDAAPFSKRGVTPIDRAAVRGWPVALMTRADPTPIEGVRAMYARRHRPFMRKVAEAVAGGPSVMIGRARSYLTWRWLRLRGKQVLNVAPARLVNGRSRRALPRSLDR